MERFLQSPDFLQDIFLEETWKNIDKIDSFIESKAALEEIEISQTEVDSLFRTMHGVKGSASMMGYPAISETAHSAEDLFSYLREGEAADPFYQLPIADSADAAAGDRDGA